MGAWLGKAAQERPRCSPKLSQNEGENLPKLTPNGAQEVARRANKWGKNAIETKRAGACHRSPIFGRKSRQHGPNLGPKMEPKSHKNRYKNQSKKQYILGSIFGRVLVDLGSKMEPSWHQNRIKNHSQLRKAIFEKNFVFLMEQP